MTTTLEALNCLKKSHKIHAELIECINSTGGLVLDPENPSLEVPQADDTWIDLAICAENNLHQCREIESILDAAGHPLADEEKCPALIHQET